jgi:hypothetical protein
MRTVRIQIKQVKQTKASLMGQMMGVEQRPGWLVQLLMDQGMTQAQATAEANRRLKSMR